MHQSEAEEQLHAAGLPELFNITHSIPADWDSPKGKHVPSHFFMHSQTFPGCVSLDAVAQYRTLPFPHKEWNASKKAVKLLKYKDNELTILLSSRSITNILG